MRKKKKSLKNEQDFDTNTKPASDENADSTAVDFLTDDDKMSFEEQLEVLGDAAYTGEFRVFDQMTVDFENPNFYENLDESVESSDDEFFEDKSSDKKDFGLKLARFIIDGIDVAIVALAVVMILLTSVLRYSPVEGSSMQPTMDEGHILLISGFFYTPRRGDIIVIQLPNNLEQPLVKRVIAIGGDNLRIDFANWRLYVNGELLDETGIINETAREQGLPLTSGNLQLRDGIYESVVPHGHVFVLGDNRNGSSDSRHSVIGYVNERYVVGRAIFRIWPFSDFGTLR